VIQKKMGRPVQFEITEQTRSAVGEWLSGLGARRGQYLFPSRFQAQAQHTTSVVRFAPHSPAVAL
jgi:hypothetical protein